MHQHGITPTVDLSSARASRSMIIELSPGRAVALYPMPLYYASNYIITLRSII